MTRNLDKAVVCILGLGYVGLPLAEAFARTLKVIAFDISDDKIRKVKRNSNKQNPIFTNNPEEIAKADFNIICVSTPVTKSKEPDLSYVKSAAEIVGRNMKRGAVVILESTVYPGVTEDIVKPILEQESGLKCGAAFKIAYSPERINPGDQEHTVDKITKLVAGMDKQTTELVAELYGRVTPQIFQVKDIRTAEAAKVVENTQRDLNIALVNELAIIFQKMGLNTKDVLDAAATKWNFQRYSPGLVGGYCISVAPYYLMHKAKEVGYSPQVILAGRAVNEHMPKHVAEITIKALDNAGKIIKDSKVMIMGLTYKENVPDARETPVREVITELKEYGIEIFGYDPLLSENDIESECGIKPIRTLLETPRIDAIILAVAHNEFKKISLAELKGIMSSEPILIDIRGLYADNYGGKGIHYYSL